MKRMLIVAALLFGAVPVVAAGEESGAPKAPASRPETKEPPSSDAAPLSQRSRKAIVRGLAFLQDDAAKWRKDHSCATCHHGTMTVWALSEAKRQGYPVAAETWTQTVKWTKERLKTIDAPRDTRPGWSMVNTPALYLAAMAQAVPGQEALSTEELKQVTGHLLRHQEADGSWAWSSAPAKNRPPPFFESDEVATLLAWMVLAPHVPVDAKEKSPIRDSREKAAQWLAKNKPNDTTQAAALRLLARVRAGEPAKALQADIDALLKRRNPDGGFGQLKDLPSDAYATGQSLYVLSQAGLANDRPEVRQAVAFLLGSQKDDGSWPMTRREIPGEKRSGNLVPITYFGSAWATLGLMRCAPK